MSDRLPTDPSYTRSRRQLSSYDAVELRFHSENESTERWSELTSTRYGPLALTCSALGSSRSTSTESFRIAVTYITADAGGTPAVPGERSRSNASRITV